MTVYLILEGIDLGDHCLGVFLTEKDAKDGCEKLAKLKKERYGENTWPSTYTIEPYVVGELQFP